VRPSDWCERHIVLPADAPIPGRWRNRNMPQVAGILDASFHPRRKRDRVLLGAPDRQDLAGL